MLCIISYVLLTKALSYDGSSWRESNQPQYRYDYDATNMALYDGKPVMIGAYEHNELPEYRYNDTISWRSNASYFEVYDPKNGDWSDLKRNPFFPEGTKYYWEGTSVTKNDSFIVFGGEISVYDDINCDENYCRSTSRNMLLVLEYKNDRWYNLGTVD